MPTCAKTKTASRAMLSPAVLKEFTADIELVRASCRTAQRYLEAEGQHASSGATMKRTWKAAVECGAALKRMHDAESYLDSFDSWAGLCRSLKIPRTVSYRLMSCAEQLKSVPPASIGKIHTPLSVAPEPDDDEDVPTAPEGEAEEGDAAEEAAFKRLREHLAAAPHEPIDEGEAPRKARAEHDCVWAERQLASVQAWFEANGMGPAAAPHFKALAALAATAPAPPSAA